MIGREREIKELNKLYENDSAELIAIYGRLGDGKTYLVEEVFQTALRSDIQGYLQNPLILRGC